LINNNPPTAIGDMQTILSAILYLHIAAGFTALVTGLIPMLTKKGGKNHVLFGRVYFWSMFIVALTALLRFQLKLNLIFLAGIAVFSFYNTFTGVRLTQRKDSQKPSFLDYFAIVVCFLTAIAMFYFASYSIRNENTSSGILFIVFGIFIGILIAEDLRVFTNRKVIDNTNKPVPSRYWFQNHISRMGGSYIATVTAFLVVNNPPYIPGIVAFIAPGIIGAVIISRTRMHYRKKQLQQVSINAN
jgi:uncharacterized membrane protein